MTYTVKSIFYFKMYKIGDLFTFHDKNNKPVRKPISKIEITKFGNRKLANVLSKYENGKRYNFIFPKKY